MPPELAGDSDLPGLTDTEKPRMRGPKRATKIRKLFNLSKEDDVRKYVNTYRRTFTSATGTLAFAFRFKFPYFRSTENRNILVFKVKIPPWFLKSHQFCSESLGILQVRSEAKPLRFRGL